MARRQKTVIVTGSTSGIGLAIATQLLENNYRVIMHGSGRNTDAFDHLKTIYKHSVSFWAFDLSKDPEESFSELIKNEDNLWGLVNNAGQIPDNNMWDSSYENLSSHFKTNTFSVFILSKLFYEKIKNTPSLKGGRIVNISSVAIRFGMGRNQSIQYAATKAAIETMSTGLSRLGAEHNILVNTIRPGCVKTKIQAKRTDYDSRVALIPQKRMGEVEEIAAAAKYFLSDEAAFTTGQVLSVSGGE